MFDFLAESGTPARFLALAVLLIVATFCWCWRERCKRKSRTTLIHDYRDLLLALRSDDPPPPLAAHLERVRPPPPGQPAGLDRPPAAS